MHRLLGVAVLPFLIAFGPSRSPQTPPPIKRKFEGQFVDTRGHPVAGVTAAQRWVVGEGATMTGHGTVVSADEEGRFQGEVEGFPPFLLTAYRKDRFLAGSILLTPENEGKPLRVVMEPAAVVDIKVTAKGAGDVGPIFASFRRHVPPKGKVTPVSLRDIWSGYTGGKVFESLVFDTRHTSFVVLPPGRYWLSCFDTESKVKGQSVFRGLLQSGESYEFGHIELSLTGLAEAAGKPAPPLTVTSARGVPKGFRLESLRGKWVLIDFWGYWCGPCVAAMPDLIRFYKENAAHRNRFEILAFHDPQAKEFAQLDPKIARFEQGQWGGKLPFPIFLDATGETVKQYGINAYPTQVLIDPQGRIVRGGNLEMLKQKLAASRD